MFYDIRVMNSERMGAVWRAANDLEKDASDVDLLKVWYVFQRSTCPPGPESRINQGKQ